MKNPFPFLLGKLRERRAVRGRAALRARYASAPPEIARADWPQSLAHPTNFYERAVEFFDRRLPAEFRAHRAYFTQAGRGFGEDAFHTQWFLLFREFRPQSFLEIGVFRGQSLSLAALCARQFQLDCFVQGISPFSTAGDAVSRYRPGLDYQTDTLENFSHFKLPAPALLKAYSTDAVAAQLIGSRTWDIIYIDGNHDYDIAKADWELCAKNVSPSGLIVLDDSGLSTNFRPPAFATGGHPGPSRLATEIDRRAFTEILQIGHNRVFQKNSA